LTHRLSIGRWVVPYEWIWGEFCACAVGHADALIVRKICRGPIFQRVRLVSK